MFEEPHAGSRSCIIFDFDGVIADTERLHLSAYNAALAAHAGQLDRSLVISPEEYFSNYIVFEAREGFSHMLTDAGCEHTPELLQKLTDTKHSLFVKHLHGPMDPLPGVHRLLKFLEERRVPRAICSGARRVEIVQMLDAFQLRSHFDVMVTIEDVSQGKPAPEGYNLAFEQLNLKYHAQLRKETSLVIEDSAGGMAAGRAAGLRVLGVATNLPLKDVQRNAMFAVESLADLALSQLAEWLGLS